MKKFYNHISTDKNNPFDKWRTPNAELEEKEDEFVADQYDYIINQ